jgi:hypothetical protein
MKRIIILVLSSLLVGSVFSLNIATKNTGMKLNSPEISLTKLDSEYTLSSLDWRSGDLAQAFSQNSKEEVFEKSRYYSPKTAFAMSFLVPGAGEIYAKSYVKGALFLALETGLWTGYYLFESKGKDQRESYQNYHNHISRSMTILIGLQWLQTASEQ